MSKIGKNPISIPDKTDVSIADGTITVKGPLGAVSRAYVDGVSVVVENDTVMVTPKNNSKFSRSLWGTTASHVKNMIKGVHAKYEKKLELQGVGYKVELQPARPDDSGRSGGGTNLKFSVGFSHPVVLPVPDGIAVTVEKTLMTVTGIDKDAVGQFAANIRAVKKPEPYKGKGIRYVGEYVREKQGKKAVG
jgi:large subunit ribosomal protein L6